MAILPNRFRGLFLTVLLGIALGSVDGSTAWGQQSRPRQKPELPVQSPQQATRPGPIFGDNSPFRDGPPDSGPPPRSLDLGVVIQEMAPRRFMFGVGIDPDTGDLLRSIEFDDQNVDWTRFPSSWEDIRNGTAWHGAGQHLRLVALQGVHVRRYMASFLEPYLLGTQVSMGLDAYYHARRYREWSEQRIGG